MNITELQKRWSLHGFTALVTGGSKSIGKAIVEELAGLGARVHTCARNPEDLNKSLNHWKCLNLDVTGSICDISCQADREKLMEEVSSLFEGKLNIFVNNVAKQITKDALGFTTQDCRDTITANLESAFHLSQLSHPMLKASGAGSIVFISSIGGIVAFHDSTLYSMSKGAINQLTKNLALEWAKDHIRVNCVAPGAIMSPQLNKYYEEKNGCSLPTKNLNIPLGRHGEVVEIATIVSFLCMSAAAYITGQVIVADGGFIMSRFMF